MFNTAGGRLVAVYGCLILCLIGCLVAWMVGKRMVDWIEDGDADGQMFNERCLIRNPTLIRSTPGDVGRFWYSLFCIALHDRELLFWLKSFVPDEEPS